MKYQIVFRSGTELIIDDEVYKILISRLDEGCTNFQSFNKEGLSFLTINLNHIEFIGKISDESK